MPNLGSLYIPFLHVFVLSLPHRPFSRFVGFYEVCHFNVLQLHRIL